MLNIVVLDVVIGLIFIYLLYSLLVTIIQEIVATQFGFRAKILQRSIFRMLEDDDKFSSRFKSILYLFKKSGNGGEKNSTTYDFYNHPLIKFLGEGKHNSKPAYITRETFSKVIVDLLRGNNVKPGDDVEVLIQKALDEKKTLWGNTPISEQSLSYIKSVWADADGDVKRFKRSLENWFDETMDRASGWYKKHVQFILFIIGFGLSVAFNVDTIKIVDKLEKDPVLREQMIQHADAFVKANPDLDKQIFNQKVKFDSIQALIERKNLPQAGLDSLQKQRAVDSMNIVKSLALKAQSDTLLKRADLLLTHDINDVHHSLGLEWDNYQCNSSSLFVCILKSLVGWIITALALSLGAPFWFDLLNKLMKLRGAVATPTSDDKEKKQG
jgi:hypothetical protein